MWSENQILENSRSSTDLDFLRDLSPVVPNLYIKKKKTAVFVKFPISLRMALILFIDLFNY